MSSKSDKHDLEIAPSILDIIRGELEKGALPGEREDFGPQSIQTAAAFIGKAAKQRNAGEPIIAIETAGEGASGRVMRIAVINDDMPFLVDSIAHAISASDITIHRLLHPILSTKRNSDGVLTSLTAHGGTGSKRESLIYIETDRADAKKRRALEQSLLETLADVRVAVRDWVKMREAMSNDADHQQDEEGAALLRWFLARNLTQLGHEVVERASRTVTSRLGICTLHDKPLIAPLSLDAAFAWFDQGHTAPLIIKSNRISRVHRQILLDLIITPQFDGKGVSALSIHAGMWTSTGLAASPDKVPVLRSALSAMMTKFGFYPDSHAGKALTHALTTLPHDIVIGFDRPTLERLTLTFMSLADRPRPKLALASSALARHLYAFVWLPRDEVTTARRVQIQNMLSQATQAKMLSWSIALEEGGLALLRITLDLRDGGVIPDDAELDQELRQMVRSWLPAVEDALAETEEAGRAATLAARFASGFPLYYRNAASASEAALDIKELHALKSENDKRIRIYRLHDIPQEQLWMKVYSNDVIALSELVPIFENFGFRVMDEVTIPITNGDHGHIQRFLLELPAARQASEVINRSSVVTEAIAQVVERRSENDRFNELIVNAGLEPQSTVLIRALYRYLRQTGMAYGMMTFVETLQKHSTIATDLVQLFARLHNPTYDASLPSTDHIIAKIENGLEAVSAIDEDRVLRLLLATITATLRTNFYADAAKDALAFKFDSAGIPGLPAPLPWREIWVYSPRVEAIHLRAGPVARGGLRWSDRKDDFRTETLGLMKAQRVKNAVIVPTGAKGGFYAKQLPNPQTDRDAWLLEGTESYRIFIRSLLSITDNIVNDKIVHPDHVVIRDGDDPYLVVAADKGTASFSDIANAISEERGFWLGDAFASGGSHGYDHKAMGITARGAWISVKRHFAEMGIDVQSEPVNVIGCGDMSGDVFGNGMLLSKAIKLVAAFDHRHIFIDPNPDPAKSWEERARLFKLPRSSWADYNAELLSEGAGIFPRNVKSITLTPEIKQLLDLQEDRIEPNGLISAILKSSQDLLWFGGIGTYIKAAGQNHVDVGDPTNDRVRINAEELRVKVIGEGANLGVTQAARIAFALHGGRINADFIDNSAGVDCSDNEVNIKIALNKEMAEGRLPLDVRNVLLEDMTDAVSELVLEDNRLQALGLSIAQAGGVDELASYVRLIDTFEDSGRLDRQVEGLAPNDQLLRRAQDGQGLTRPELAILLSTAKLTLQDAIENSALSDDPSMHRELARAFPPMMQDKEPDAIATHQLRREIIATKVANRLINRLGVINPFELAEEEGCTLADIAISFVIVERLYNVDQLWTDIDDRAMSEAARLTLLSDIANAMRAQIADILRALPLGTLPDEGHKILAKGIDHLASQVDDLLTGEALRRSNAVVQRLIDLEAPQDLAIRTAGLFKLDGAVGISALANRLALDEIALTKAFTHLGSTIGIDWVQSSAARMAPSDPWERLLVAGIARDMQQIRLDFLAKAKDKDVQNYAELWLQENEARITQFRTLMNRAKTTTVPTASMLAEIASQIRALLNK